jgi:hypothetical protein
MYILNGLGTKGVMHAPYLAKQLLNLINKNLEVDKEISINRFDKLITHQN